MLNDTNMATIVKLYYSNYINSKGKISTFLLQFIIYFNCIRKYFCEFNLKVLLHVYIFRRVDSLANFYFLALKLLNYS